MAFMAASKARRACTRLFLRRYPSTLLIMPAGSEAWDIVSTWSRRCVGGACRAAKRVNGVYVLRRWRFRRVSAFCSMPWWLTASRTAALRRWRHRCWCGGCSTLADGRHGEPRSVPGEMHRSVRITAAFWCGTRLRKAPHWLGDCRLRAGSDMRAVSIWQQRSRMRHCVLANREHLRPWCMAGGCSRKRT